MFQPFGSINVKRVWEEIKEIQILLWAGWFPVDSLKPCVFSIEAGRVPVKII